MHRKIFSSIFIIYTVFVLLSCGNNNSGEKIQLKKELITVENRTSLVHIGDPGEYMAVPVVNLPEGWTKFYPVTFPRESSVGIYDYSDTLISHFEWRGERGLEEMLDFRFRAGTGRSDTLIFDEEKWRFSHTQEVARPGFYSLMRIDEPVRLAAVAGDDVLLQKYDFLEGSIPELDISIPAMSKNFQVKLTLDKNEGMKFSAVNTRDSLLVFVVIDWDYPVSEIALKGGSDSLTTITTTGKDIHVKMQWSKEAGYGILIRSAVSFISFAEAERRLEEVEEVGFASLVSDVRKKWEVALGTIEVVSDSDFELERFYSEFFRYFQESLNQRARLNDDRSVIVSTYVGKADSLRSDEILNKLLSGTEWEANIPKDSLESGVFFKDSLMKNTLRDSLRSPGDYLFKKLGIIPLKGVEGYYMVTEPVFESSEITLSDSVSLILRRVYVEEGGKYLIVGKNGDFQEYSGRIIEQGGLLTFSALRALNELGILVEE